MVELLQYQIDREPLYHLAYSLWLVHLARVELAEENQHHSLAYSLAELLPDEGTAPAVPAAVLDADGSDAPISLAIDQIGVGGG